MRTPIPGEPARLKHAYVRVLLYALSGVDPLNSHTGALDEGEVALVVGRDGNGHAFVLAKGGLGWVQADVLRRK